MKHKYTIGIDEVGRGPLAGPVSVCAVLIPDSFTEEDFKGVRDSKKLSPKKRDALFEKFKDLELRGDIKYCVSSSSSKTIDKVGISLSIKEALAKAINKLSVEPNECRVLLDGGLYAPKNFLNQETIIRGDDKEYAIAVASIIAKVTRDKEMERFSEVYPDYLFHKHKGYGTKEHYDRIRLNGLCEIHRKSFIHL